MREGFSVQEVFEGARADTYGREAAGLRRVWPKIQTGGSPLHALQTRASEHTR